MIADQSNKLYDMQIKKKKRKKSLIVR